MDRVQGGVTPAQRWTAYDGELGTGYEFRVESAVIVVNDEIGMQERPVASKRRRSGQRTEESIYAVAAELFATQGYPSTTLDQIARQVGVHKSTIFHYVASKEDLLAAILDAGLSGYVTSLESIVARDEDALTRIIGATRNHLDFVFQHGRELRIFLRERQCLSGARGKAYLRMSERYQSTFTRLIEDGVREGALRQGDATLMCLFLLGSANWVVEWFRPDGRLTAQEVTEQFVQSMICNMLCNPR